MKTEDLNQIAFKFEERIKKIFGNEANIIAIPDLERGRESSHTYIGISDWPLSDLAILTQSINEINQTEGENCIIKISPISFSIPNNLRAKFIEQLLLKKDPQQLLGLSFSNPQAEPEEKVPAPSFNETFYKRIEGALSKILKGIERTTKIPEGKLISCRPMGDRTSVTREDGDVFSSETYQIIKDISESQKGRDLEIAINLDKDGNMISFYVATSRVAAIINMLRDVLPHEILEAEKSLLNVTKILQEKSGNKNLIVKASPSINDAVIYEVTGQLSPELFEYITEHNPKDEIDYFTKEPGKITLKGKPDIIIEFLEKFVPLVFELDPFSDISLPPENFLPQSLIDLQQFIKNSLGITTIINSQERNIFKFQFDLDANSTVMRAIADTTRELSKEGHQDVKISTNSELSTTYPTLLLPENLVVEFEKRLMSHDDIKEMMKSHPSPKFRLSSERMTSLDFSPPSSPEGKEEEEQTTTSRITRHSRERSAPAINPEELYPSPSPQNPHGKTIAQASYKCSEVLSVMQKVTNQNPENRSQPKFDFKLLGKSEKLKISTILNVLNSFLPDPIKNEKSTEEVPFKAIKLTLEQLGHADKENQLIDLLNNKQQSSQR
ncbi:MAG: hypothetical protein K0R25_75 [Rickettsiaceae bacterium]|jgi:hypothetical protein|nr:hypothetical protein [Rickettsiaceae bacterium]